MVQLNQKEHACSTLHLVQQHHMLRCVVLSQGAAWCFQPDMESACLHSKQVLTWWQRVAALPGPCHQHVFANDMDEGAPHATTSTPPWLAEISHQGFCSSHTTVQTLVLVPSLQAGVRWWQHERVPSGPCHQQATPTTWTRGHHMLLPVHPPGLLMMPEPQLQTAACAQPAHGAGATWAFMPK
jgi:hypothetical protein